MQEIDISEYIDKFSLHLQNNPRVILSARFGDGKTTFLKKFEEKTKEENFVLTIYPVNYSVAKNEDVFEYIKHDILIQLLQQTHLIKDFQFDKDSIWKAIKDNIFTLDNTIKAIKLASLAVPASKPIANLLTFISKKVESNKSISKAWNEYQENKVSISKYMDHFAQMQGGLYEEDGYTLLIKEALNQVKQRTILIIEDLDRIDPKHLFRILNVLGAHVDEANNQNKFGFDNIVIVLDYTVTSSIFHHMYGTQANYKGYMSKFLVSYPFEFSITEVAYSKIYDFIEQKCQILRDEMRNFQMVINKSRSNFDEYLHLLSVRDIAHALDNIDSQIKVNNVTINFDEYSADIPILWLLAILKRLNVQISLESVNIGLQSLSTKTLLNTLGCMVLVNNIFPGKQICIKQEIFIVSVRKAHGSKYCKFDSTNVYLGQYEELDEDKVINRAIKESAKYIADVSIN